SKIVSSGIRPEPFQWHHVAVSYDSPEKSCKLYVDGKLAAAETFEGSRVTSPDISLVGDFLAIGGMYVVSGGAFPDFKGYLDELAFSEIALSKAQIDTLAAGVADGDPFLERNRILAYQKIDDYPLKNSGIVLIGNTPIFLGTWGYCSNDNQPPVANAGEDQVINPPANEAILDGSASKDPDGSIVSYTWTKISGPQGDQSSIANPNKVTTTVTGLKEGEYVFQLTVKDDKGSEGKDEVRIRVNQPPVVNAGRDTVIHISILEDVIQATLSGTATDSDGDIIGIKWEKFNGDEGDIIVEPDKIKSDVYNLKKGIYEYTLSVTDNNGATASDNVIIKINIKPSCISRDDTMYLPSEMHILEKVSAIDSDGTIEKYEWEQIDGPTELQFNDHSIEHPKVSNIEEGKYKLRLIVTDNDGGKDTTEMILLAKKSNILMLNPAPVMADKDNPGYLKNDISLVESLPEVKGAAADGLTKVLIVANINKKLKFEIQGTGNGYISSLSHQEDKKDTSIEIDPEENEKVVAIYNVPEGLGIQGERSITIAITSVDDESINTYQTLHLVQPPLLLVHGMWSSPVVWHEGGFINTLNSQGFSNIKLVNYRIWNANTFDPQSIISLPIRMEIAKNILEAINIYNKNEIASTRVDVVGHSLGGLMTRSYIQQYGDLFPGNYYQGYVRRLITLGTPHLGTPIGPLLYNTFENFKTAGSLTGLVNRFEIFVLNEVILHAWLSKRIGSCHRDFDPNYNTNSALRNLKRTNVKAHSVVGNYYRDGLDGFACMNGIIGSINKTIYGLDKDLNDEYRESFGTPGSTEDVFSDVIVPIPSQSDKLTEKFLAIYSNTTHSEIPGGKSMTLTDNKQIQNDVAKLLMSSDTSKFADYFPSASEPAYSGRISSNMTEQKPNTINRFANDSSYIAFETDFLKPTYIAGTGIIPVKALPHNGAKVDSVYVLFEALGVRKMSSSAPYSLDVSIPVNIPTGRLNISLIAFGDSGRIYTDTASVYIQNNNKITNFICVPEAISLDSSLRESPLDIIGFINSSGKEEAISLNSYFKTYKKNSPIFDVTDDGAVIATRPGKDSIIIIIDGIKQVVQVTVDSNYPQSFKQNSSIDFPSIDDIPLGAEPLAMWAKSSSDVNVTFTLVKGPVELKGNIIYYNDTGTVTIRASAPGNAYFNAPADVVQTFKILPNQQTQTLTFDAIPAQTFGDPPVPLSAASSSNLPVTYSVVSGPGTIKDDSLLITGAGEIVVKAVQEGNSNYASAADEQTILVSKALQSLVFDSIPSRSYSQEPVILTGSSSSGLPVVYTVVSGPATVTGNSLLMTGTGTVVVQATQPGNNNYNASDTIQRTFCVTASQPAAINGDTLSCTGSLTYYIHSQ
ncbi:MAG TPA: PKD domain-containing protein, partial [Agriterribacter sp.]|nr:PKD domain-containing protein [Agriterribacter sp.]